MKLRSRPRPTAFSLTELLIVVAIIGILAVSFLPVRKKGNHSSSRLRCVRNQKSIGTAYRVFASDNGDRYPLQTTNHPYLYPPGGVGRSPGAIVSSNAQSWQVFQCMWNEIQSPKVLLCPSDRVRATYNRTTDFAALAGASGVITTASLGHPENQNQAVSYTALATADESRPLLILTTDRNINSATTNTATTSLPLLSGTRYTVASPTAATAMFWVGSFNEGLHGSQGNLTFADGSVQLATATVLQTALRNSGETYGWGTATTNGLGDSIFLLP